jgi:carbon starvation protein
MAHMQQIVFNDYVNTSLAAIFIFVVVSVLFFGIRECIKAYQADKPTSKELPFEPMPAHKVM